MTWISCVYFFFNDTATTEIYTLSLHDALPISWRRSSFDFGEGFDERTNSFRRSARCFPRMSSGTLISCHARSRASRVPRNGRSSSNCSLDGGRHQTNRSENSPAKIVSASETLCSSHSSTFLGLEIRRGGLCRKSEGSGRCTTCAYLCVRIRTLRACSFQALSGRQFKRRITKACSSACMCQTADGTPLRGPRRADVYDAGIDVVGL